MRRTQDTEALTAWSTRRTCENLGKFIVFVPDTRRVPMAVRPSICCVPVMVRALGIAIAEGTQPERSKKSIALKSRWYTKSSSAQALSRR